MLHEVFRGAERDLVRFLDGFQGHFQGLFQINFVQVVWTPLFGRYLTSKGTACLVETGCMRSCRGSACGTRWCASTGTFSLCISWACSRFCQVVIMLMSLNPPIWTPFLAVKGGRTPYQDIPHKKLQEVCTWDVKRRCMKYPFWYSILSVHDTSHKEAVHSSSFTAKQFREKELHSQRFRDKELRPCTRFLCAYVTRLIHMLSMWCVWDLVFAGLVCGSALRRGRGWYLLCRVLVCWKFAWLM